MKYIRTKDGIYEIDETFKRDNQIAFFDNKEQTHGYIIGFFEGKVALNQADTIEELCDEFYAIPLYDADIEIAGLSIYIKKGKHYFVHKEEIEKFIPSVKIKTSELYGAIWTDKGLIYVAKMNEKGKLELL